MGDEQVFSAIPACPAQPDPPIPGIGAASGGFPERQSFNCPAIQSVLLFIDPGVHVETSRPAVRIVLIDGIRNLVANLLQTDESHARRPDSHAGRSAGSFARPQPVQDLLGEGEDFFGKDLIQPVLRGNQFENPTSRCRSLICRL